MNSASWGCGPAQDRKRKEWQRNNDQKCLNLRKNIDLKILEAQQTPSRRNNGESLPKVHHNKLSQTKDKHEIFSSLRSCSKEFLSRIIEFSSYRDTQLHLSI